MFTTAEMSRIVVAGTLDQLAATIELTAKLNAIHLIDHDGTEFGLGTPDSAADEISKRVAMMRGCAASLSPDASEEVLAAPLVRRALDDDILSQVDSAIAMIQQLEDVENLIESESEKARILRVLSPLGLELELMSEYKSLEASVGTVPDLEEFRLALNPKKSIGQLSSGVGKKDGVVAVFTPNDQAVDVQTLLTSIGFQPLQIPTGTGMPSSILTEVESAIEDAETKRDGLKQDLDEWRRANGGMLLGGMELLERDLDSHTAPIKLAVSDHAFVMEGWVATAAADETRAAIQAIAAHVSIEEFEMPSHHGHDDDEVELPPIAFTNPNSSKPYELLTDAVGRPKYGRIDPTSFMFLTYPIFFGIMLGDLAYGLITIALGAWLIKKFNRIDMAVLAGKLLIYIGASTAIFGIIFGEFAGFEFLPQGHCNIDHLVGVAQCEAAHGHYGWEKAHAPGWVAWMANLYPNGGEFHWVFEAPLNLVLAFPFHRVGSNLEDLIVLTLYLGVAHLFLGMAIGFRDVLKEHGMTAAIFEKGSWMLVLGGGFFWVYAFIMQGGDWTDQYVDKLALMSSIGGAVMVSGIVMVVIMLWKYEGIPLPIAIGLGPLESLQILSNVISYVRLFAVGIVGVKIAELGNEKFFTPAAEIITDFATDPLGIVVGILTITLLLILWMGVQIFALVLGLFSPNVQAARLHFVEWMGKFYEVGGVAFSPFGHKQHFVEVE